MSENESAKTAENAAENNEKGAPAVTDNAADLRYIAVTMTPELLAAIDKNRGETSRGGFLKQIICEKLEVEYSAKPARHAKYASDEERDAAKKAQTASRNLKIRALLKLHSNNNDLTKLTAEEREAIA